MSPLPIVFAHGLEGAPQGTKIRALQAAGLQVIAPDGRGLPLAERIAGIEEATRAGGFILAGSSYGGLAATWLAVEHPERFVGLLLCAPALHFCEPPVDDPEQLVIPTGLPTHILHGVHDEIVPIGVSERLVERSGAHVVLEEVHDGHRLADSLGPLVAAARHLAGG